MTSPVNPGTDASSATLDTGLARLETAVYRSMLGVVEACESIAASADAQGLVQQAIRARMLAADARSRQGDLKRAHAELLALHAQAAPWPTLMRRAAMYLASACDRLGLRVESVRWVEASLSADPLADTPAWHAEALMVAALFARSASGADYTLVERAMAAVRAACDPVLVSITAANFAELAAEAGELVHACHFADEAEAVMRRNPECAGALTWESVARARLAAGEMAGAEHAMRESLRQEQTLGCSDVNGDPWLSYAEVRLAAGDADATLAMLEHPRRRQRHASSSWTSTRELRVRARARAAQGRWEQAYRHMEDYMEAYQKARSLEADRAAAESSAAVAVGDARRQAQHFEQLALTDPLTGLPNRRHAERWLAEHAASGVGSLCVAIADLDHFKRINDNFSHDAGDVVLQRFGALLMDGMNGPGLFVARLGGEEFLLAFAEGTPETALTRCQALVDRLRRTLFSDVLGGHTVTVSIGLAHGRRPALSSALQRKADEALYEAKRAGRDRVLAAAPVASASMAQAAPDALAHQAERGLLKLDVA